MLAQNPQKGRALVWRDRGSVELGAQISRGHVPPKNKQLFEGSGSCGGTVDRCTNAGLCAAAPPTAGGLAKKQLWAMAPGGRCAVLLSKGAAAAAL